jgi:hypothetical protein
MVNNRHGRDGTLKGCPTVLARARISRRARRTPRRLAVGFVGFRRARWHSTCSSAD